MRYGARTLAERLRAGGDSVAGARNRGEYGDLPTAERGPATEPSIRNPGELAEIKIVGGNGGMGENDRYGELTPADMGGNSPPASGLLGCFRVARAADVGG